MICSQKLDTLLRKPIPKDGKQERGTPTDKVCKSIRIGVYTYSHIVVYMSIRIYTNKEI